MVVKPQASISSTLSNGASMEEVLDQDGEVGRASSLTNGLSKGADGCDGIFCKPPLMSREQGEKFNPLQSSRMGDGRAACAEHQIGGHGPV